MLNIQKHPLDYPWDTASLHANTRKFLKNMSTLSSLESPSRKATVKIVGGYTSDIIQNWIRIFADYYGVAVEIEESDWGPAFTIDVSDETINNVQLIVCLNHSRDIIAAGQATTNYAVRNPISLHLERLLDNAKNANIPVFMTSFDQLQSGHPAEKRSQTLNYKSAVLNAMMCEKQLEHNLLTIFSSQQLCTINNEAVYSTSRDWYQFGHCYSANGSILLGEAIARHLANHLGLYKKALVVDLDNTLWGGVIGDDGKEGIELGQETARGRTFTDIQAHILQLKKRGVFLAISSKNDEAIAKEGFQHPASVLKWDDFAFHAINWDNKSSNLERIASALNIGLDSIVFIDDNPAERAEVRSRLPMVTIPDCGENPEDHLAALMTLDLFHRTSSLTNEDLLRNANFQTNKKRETLRANSVNREDFLRSINTKLTIKRPTPAEFDRTLQLTNKTNQFNLTTKRLTQAEFTEFQADPNKDVFVAYVSDAFGEYGLTSVMYIEYNGTHAHIDNWLMSCRIFSKTVEHAMFKYIVSQLLDNGVQTLGASFTLSKKNVKFQNIWSELGFTKKEVPKTENSIEFRLDANVEETVATVTHFCEFNNA